jgi:hypothetical protein
MPPVHQQLLNKLVSSIVNFGYQPVFLVGVETWDHRWLNRTFTLYHEDIVEDTHADADMQERLEWWIGKRADGMHAGCEDDIEMSMENVHFISYEEFYEHVPHPREEMMDLILGWDLIGQQP